MEKQFLAEKMAMQRKFVFEKKSDNYINLLSPESH